MFWKPEGKNLDNLTNILDFYTLRIATNAVKSLRFY
ncbi:hypothetical protein LTAR_01175 [Leptolinea tardivitalis]|nr:hypothetical protein LTAR_01175 [Leptolinea tardivitalis]